MARFKGFDLSYVPPQEWRIAKIPKKSGGLRTIYIPNDALKEVQRQLLEYLYRFTRLVPKEVATGFVPGRSLMDGRKAALQRELHRRRK